MKVLIKSAEIIDERSPLNSQRKNIVIEGGKITDISDEESSADKIISGDQLKISIGWFDLWTYIGDPGDEHKEDISSGTQAAASGGFTEVAVLPNTNPVVQNKNAVQYLKSVNPQNLTQIHPIGAVTQSNEGSEITEMIDLYESGAVAFSDGYKPIWNTDILLKSLLYLQKFNGLLIQRPEDKWLNMFGTMNEGRQSTLLGLKGMPSLSEELTIERDLRLLDYSGGKLHFSNISTKRSVALIRNAKEQGLQVTCDVAAHQLVFDDNSLTEFDTNYKVNPPFRTQEDIDALLKGIEDDTIDAIVSSHRPQDEESKNLEFDLADFGIIGLQSVFPILCRLIPSIPLPKLIHKISYTPRNLLGLPLPSIEVGSPANLTVFDCEQEWIFNEQTNRSKSKNTPFWQQSLKGLPKAVFNNQKIYFADSV